MISVPATRSPIGVEDRLRGHKLRGDENIIYYSHAWRSELGVKIGKISAIFQSKTLIIKSKNQISQKNFICLYNIELRESGIENHTLFSTQTRR